MTLLMRLAAAGFFLLCSSAFSTTWGQIPGSIRVLDIQPTTGVTRVSAGVDSLSGGMRLTKFLEDGIRVPAALLTVHIAQTPGLAPRRAELRLHYRMDSGPEIKTLIHPVSNRGGNPQTIRLEIPLTAENGYRVTAWRLQLVADSRVMEEYHSAAWKEAQ